MNKLTKGAIAAGAGIVLLLGGSGTYMSWSDEDTVNGAIVSAGQLDVTATDGTWKVNNLPVTNIGAYPIVPGDTVVYTTDLSVTAQGENLKASLVMDKNSIAPATPTVNADVALAAELKSTAELSLSDTPTGMVTTSDDVTYTIDAGSTVKTEQMTATVTLTFPFTDADPTSDQNLAKKGSVRLSDMGVSLTQVP